jgi:hypothetical protein
MSVLRRIFGKKKDEIIEIWRKLRNGELHDLYSSPGIIRMIKPRTMRWAWHIALIGKDEFYGILLGNPKVRRQLGRPRHRWEDNI